MERFDRLLLRILEALAVTRERRKMLEGGEALLVSVTDLLRELEYGRKLVVSKRDAYLLQELAGTGLEILEVDCEGLMIYINRRGTGRYDDKDYYGWGDPS